MVVNQITLTAQQWALLHAIAQEIGTTEDALIVEAVNRFIHQFEHESGLVALREARGMWADRLDLPRLENLRSEWERFGPVDE